MTKNELTLYAPTINLPALGPDRNDILETVQDNMSGLGSVQFTKIAMPAGGGIAFVVVDEGGQEVPAPKLTGVIVDKYHFKAWYAKSFEEKGEQDTGAPDCFSADGVVGTGCAVAGIPAGQLCETCPKNQWGSSRKGGRGKDCADKVRVYLLQEGNVFPVFLDLPPTSIGAFKDYMGHLANKAKHYRSVVSVIGLVSERSDAGVKYSKATFGKAGELTRDEARAIKQYAETLSSFMHRNITRESVAEVGPTIAVPTDSGEDDAY